MAPRVGDRIGPYEVTGSLGAGGMGEVFRIGANPASPAVFAGSDKYLVSTNGGTRPRWTRGGNELVYLSDDGGIVAAPIAAGLPQPVGQPQRLFTLPADVELWNPLPDGSTFLILGRPADSTSTPFTVIVNWVSTLEP
jgi:hypothetical protein